MKISEHRDTYISADAEGRAKMLAKVYGLSAHQMWKHKQSGKWIISHAGVQSIAAQEGVMVSYDVIHIERGFVVIHATPLAGGVVGQPTFGEASTENTQQKYLVAMAEKRAFDRAVLICVLQEVGGYGADFYGEDEADDFKKPADVAPVVKKKPTASAEERLIEKIIGAKDHDELEEMYQLGHEHKAWTGKVMNAYLDKKIMLSGGKP